VTALALASNSFDVICTYFLPFYGVRARVQFKKCPNFEKKFLQPEEFKLNSTAIFTVDLLIDSYLLLT
jgi:hypothetical protein